MSGLAIEKQVLTFWNVSVIYNPPAVGGDKIETRESGRTALPLHSPYDVAILQPRRFLQG